MDGHRGGWIEIIAGGMFSGKSEELIRRLRRAVIARQRVQVFKPIIDDRFATDEVVSRDDRRLKAIPVATSAELLSRVEIGAQVVGIDEIQFFDAGVVDLCKRLTHNGVRVIAAGLDLDFRGEPFGPMPLLMAEAEMVDKLQAICVVCGAPASRTQRLIDGQPANYDDPVIMVGAKENYEARCRHCHEVPRADENVIELPLQDAGDKPDEPPSHLRVVPGDKASDLASA